MNLMVLPNRLCLIVKLYINRPELLPDTHVLTYKFNVFSLKNCIYLIVYLIHPRRIHSKS